MLTKAQFEQAAGISAALADKYYASMVTAFNEYIPYTPLRMAHVIAQVGHESQGFRRLEEDLMYRSAGRIVAVFGKRNGLTPAIASRLVGDPEALANYVYGGAWGTKNLGNIEAGDGYRFRGSGLIQITGRYNFYIVSRALGIDLMRLPELLRRDPDTAARASVWWLWHKGCVPLMDADDVVGLTRRINAGLNGLEDRKARLVRAKAVFK